MTAYFLLIFVITTGGIYGSHFNGGTITWTPVVTTNSTVTITIKQSYSWTYPTVACTTDVPVSSNTPNVNLTCIANCSTDGGYSNSPINILTDCTSFSSALRTMSSARSVNITLAIGTHFYLAYQGSAWRNLYASSIGNLSWTISTLIDLRVRPDGIINSSPVSNVLSPQYVIVNTTSLIPVPVSDANAGDDVRCRWAKNNTNGFINECSQICYPTGLPSGTTLSNCTISFTGQAANACYPIALQIEDFINTTSTDPMSSVPVQMLICVRATPACTILPVMVPITDCLEVQVGVTTNFSLYVMNLCNLTASITEVIISKSISSMTAGKVRNSTTGSSLAYIQLSWTPQMSQVGTQQLCAYAYNSLLVRSAEYCVTFSVTTSSPNCPGNTTTNSSTNAVSNSNSSVNIAMIVGLSLLALILSICCCCCWLYYYFRNVRRQRRRKNKNDKDEERPTDFRLVPRLFSENPPFKSFKRSGLFRRMSKHSRSGSVLPINVSLLGSDLPRNQVLDGSLEHNRSLAFETSLTAESVLKESIQNAFMSARNTFELRNITIPTKSEIINDTRSSRNQNHIQMGPSHSEVTVEDTDKLALNQNSTNAVKKNKTERSIIAKAKVIKVNRSLTGYRQGSRLSKPEISKVTVVRVRSLSNNYKQPKSLAAMKILKTKGENMVMH